MQLLGQTRTLTKSISRTVLNFMLPPTCAACANLIVEPPGLCADCWQQLRPITRPYCARLGTPFTQDLGPDALSAQAIAYPPILNRVRGALVYGDIARQLVSGLKYYDRLEQAGLIAQLMQQAGHELLRENDILMPIPLHWARQLSRRYNQSQLLAKALGKKVHMPVESLTLRRARPTRTQVGLTHDQRADNVKNAFKIVPEKAGNLLGKNILLIDDVYTSGATGNAAARTLHDAGAARVDMLVFALAIGGFNRDDKIPK